VRPLRRQLTGLRAWITGQRKDQSPGTRAAVPVVQVDPAFQGADGGPGSLVKFNPLSNVSSAEVWNFLRIMARAPAAAMPAICGSHVSLCGSHVGLAGLAAAARRAGSASATCVCLSILFSGVCWGVVALQCSTHRVLGTCCARAHSSWSLVWQEGIGFGPDAPAAHQGVPTNELHACGYISIGCEPCTRAVLPNQHEREGRWWWEARARPPAAVTWACV